MQLSELRIGNWVKFTPDGGMFLVSEINNFENTNTVNGLNLSDIEPIPLTDQWLKRFGFEEKDGHYYKECRRKRFELLSSFDEEEKDFVVRYRDDVGLEYCSIAWTDYVHSLQNLYFPLMGEELTIQ